MVTLKGGSAQRLSTAAQLLFLAATAMILLLVLAFSAYRFGTEINRVAVELSTEVSNKAQVQVRALSKAGSEQARTALFAIVLSALVITPLGFATFGNFAWRLRTITETMLRIARNESNVHISSIHDLDEIGDMARAVNVFKANAVALMHNQQQLEQVNFRFDAALNNMTRGLSMFDSDGLLLVCNRYYQNLYGLSDEICQPGVSLNDITYWRAKKSAISNEDLQRWHDRYAKMVAKRTSDSMTFKIDGGRTILMTYEPLSDGSCVIIHEDITQKRFDEEKINSLARIDTLTGVANRYHLRERLVDAFDSATAEHGIAVCMIDLDNFKEVNDTLGHPAGDILLRTVAERIKKSLRKSDFVGRLGGDEFAVIQMGVSNDHDAEVAAYRIAQILSEPYQIQGQTVSIGVSIGIALVPRYATTPDESLQKADIALYRAKALGRGTVIIFKPELETELQERRCLQEDLGNAIKNSELRLLYQPILDVRSGRITSCEALMRWQHPQLGTIPPDRFIPAAEECGLIGAMGEWALRYACQTAATWPSSIKVSVNLSAVQIETTDLRKTVLDALDEAHLPPSRLVLEVTETLLLKNKTRASKILNELREAGVAIALDDFGTGYASLSYLHSFPFDKIKIDRIFIDDMASHGHAKAIVTSVCQLAGALSMQTVAEGVETHEQLLTLTNCGCGEIQGYFISRPVPAADLSRIFIQRWAPSPHSA